MLVEQENNFYVPSQNMFFVDGLDLLSLTAVQPHARDAVAPPP